MKLVIQRVLSAQVYLEETGEVVGKIKKGLFVLIGIKKGDDIYLAHEIAEKLLKLRIMSDAQGKMNLSVSDINAEILAVSQFTLYADTSGGRRPSFIEAESPDKAEKIYGKFVEMLKSGGVNVATGRFGEYMKIKTVLDGPVTIIIEK